MKSSLRSFIALAVVLAPLPGFAGFSIPQPNPTFHFPADHGSHPDYQLEWWYLTGHLFDEQDHRYGFQATFFRQVQSATAGDSTTFHLAHMALLDVTTKKFIYQTRLNRSGWDASSEVGKMKLRNGPWSLKMQEDSETILLQGGVRNEAGFALELVPEKTLVRFGDAGYSRKGTGPAAASYYLTFSRLKTSGSLRLNGHDLNVHGLAWMDHEISSSQLGEGLVGWDWVCIQFLDGRELMLYRLRRADGGSDPASTLTWVGKDAKTQTEPFEWKALETWQSPSTGGRYPSKVDLSTVDPMTGSREVYRIEPLAPDQELAAGPGGIAYWEGACRVRDEKGREVGSAYLELTGYVKPLKLSAK